MKVSTFALGTTLIDKIRIVFVRLFGCSHPDNMICDLGDEDRGTDWYCFNCDKDI